MIPITQLKNLPSCCGIYRVLDAEGRIIYVGQARNIHQRWNRGHHKIGTILDLYRTDVFIDWVELPEWLLNRAENVAVNHYQPSLNTRKPPIV
jgi:excinuclease UvrABC nuclease subunit